MDTLSRTFIRKSAIALVTAVIVAVGSFIVVHDVTRKAAAADADSAANAAEAPFLAENDAAMNKMMADMSVKPSGDVDRDFVEMMVPHHQGAIDMAQAVLRHGKNEQLRRLAQEIIVTQQQEIAAMRLALGDTLPPSVPSPTQPAPAQGSSQPAPQGGMMHHDSMSHNSMNMK